MINYSIPSKQDDFYYIYIFHQMWKLQSLILPSIYTVEFSSAQVEFNLSYHKWYAHVGLLTAVEGELAWANIFPVIKNILLSKIANTLKNP